MAHLAHIVCRHPLRVKPRRALHLTELTAVSVAENGIVQLQYRPRGQKS